MNKGTEGQHPRSAEQSGHLGVLIAQNADWAVAAAVVAILMSALVGTPYSKGYILAMPLGPFLLFTVSLLSVILSLYVRYLLELILERLHYSKDGFIKKFLLIGLPLIIQILVISSGYLYVFGPGLPLYLSVCTFIVVAKVYDFIIKRFFLGA